MTDALELIAVVLIYGIGILGLSILVAWIAEGLSPGCTTRLFARLFDNDDGLFDKK